MHAEVAVWCCSQCGAVYYKDFPRCPSDGAEVVLAMRDPMLGQTIGTYAIDRLIGEGGMGRVYAAHHVKLAAKRYAIKVLLGDAAATTSMRKRFAQEAESASRLSHPNIVQVHDFGEMPGGLPYIVMDFIEGRPLTDMIGSTPMEPTRVIRFARAICEGLAHAHEANVVHRDLKPDNVMVVVADDGSEVPRIADFGLATTIDEGQPRITTTGMAMGTPAYAAPEQMAGRRVDHRADLYALGMTMFEMLTGGELPFEGHPMETVAAKASREARRVTEVVPLELPHGLEDLVAHLVRRKSAERPDDAREVIAELDRIAAGATALERTQTVVDPRDTLSVSTERAEPRRGRLAWIGGGLVAVAVSGGLAWSQLRGRDEPTAAKVEVAKLEPANVERAKVEPAKVEPAKVEPAKVDNVEPEKVEADVAPPEVAMPEIAVGSSAPHRHLKGRPHEAVKKPKKPKTVELRPAKPITVATAPVTQPQTAPEPPVTQPPATQPPVTPPPPPAPPKPVTFVASLGRVDVQGALSQAVVRSAVERVMPAIRQCTTTAAHQVHVHFAIDEARRPRDPRGSGAAANCVIAALAGVRTDTAPDVGDAAVDVEVDFTAKP